jgi:hypothetical protein
MGVDLATAIVFLVALTMTLTLTLAAIGIETDNGSFLGTDRLRRAAEVSDIVALNDLSIGACAKCGDRGFTG